MVALAIVLSVRRLIICKASSLHPIKITRNRASLQEPTKSEGQTAFLKVRASTCRMDLAAT